MQLRQTLRTLARRLAPGIMADRARAYERSLRAREGITGLGSRLEPVVVAGPFEGLRYPADRVAEVDAPVAKFLGVYEKELSDVFESPADRFIDIGCADGYYAVGMALRGVAVEAYDIAASAREFCADLAKANGARVTLGKAFGVEAARTAGDALVLCDIEGAEDALFSPEVVSLLARARVVIEVHEHVAPGLGADLKARFAATHDVREIPQEPRGRVPELDGWTDEEIAMALTEHRPPAMHWLDFTPRA